MRDLVGIALRDGHADVVAVRRGLRARRVVAAFTVPLDEAAGPAIRTHLREAGVRARHAHLAIPRRTAVAKAIELPAVPGADLRQMVGFELERHLPFPAADALFDFEVLEGAAAESFRVLLVAVERRVYERLAALVRDAGLTPRLVGIGVHSLARLAITESAARGRLVLWVDAAEVEVAVVVGGRVVASRSVPLPETGETRERALTEELERTLDTLPERDRAVVDEVVVGGGPIPALGWDRLPVRAGVAAPPPLGDAGPVSLPALAVALERPRRGRGVVNLLPDELRPRPFPWPVAVTAALALLTVALGAAIPAVTLVRERRALATLDAELARLAPEVRRAEQLSAEVEHARREAAALREFEDPGLRSLPVLQDLTETLPADVWLTSLSADRNGLELAGFANAASQLIALLEALPALERVEFISPVTKGRDREQFRLKAAWERRPGAPGQ
jgi:Tfp pilus assembly protein PilN